LSIPEVGVLNAAIDGLELVHVPPATVPVNVIDVPLQNAVLPIMTGAGFTVIVRVVMQLVGNE
jgi:hypothetical protein